MMANLVPGKLMATEYRVSAALRAAVADDCDTVIARACLARMGGCTRAVPGRQMQAWRPEGRPQDQQEIARDTGNQATNKTAWLRPGRRADQKNKNRFNFK